MKTKEFLLSGVKVFHANLERKGTVACEKLQLDTDSTSCIVDFDDGETLEVSIAYLSIL